MFCEDMADFSVKIGDIVLVLCGWNFLLGIAKLTSKHSYRPELAVSRGDEFFDHVRRVEWIEKCKFEDRIEIPSVKGFNNTIAIVKDGSDRWSRLISIDVNL